MRLRWPRRAALPDDIGKLAVSNTILDEPGGLTDEEFAEVRQHPRHTAAILSRITAFAGIAAAASAHHERLDGRGYLLGPAAAQLTTEARILAVSDVYETLTADRPDRAPMAREEALAALRRDAGTAFDAECVAALEEASRELDRGV